MEKLFENYSLTDSELKITEKDKNKKFINSLVEYFEKNMKLSVKQENAFLDLIQRELKYDDIINMDFSNEQLAYEVFFRYDHLGNPLRERKLLCLRRHLHSQEINAKITDCTVAEPIQINKWEFSENIQFPKDLKIDEKLFTKLRYDDFSLALNKLKKNKFKKVSTKNRTIRIIRQLLDPNSELSLSNNDRDFLLGRYKNWE